MWLAYFLLVYLLSLSLSYYSNSYKLEFETYNGVVPRQLKDYSYMFFSFGILTFLACMRGIEVGADTANYVGIFEEIRDEKYVDPFVMFRFEPGFLIYLKILSFVSDNPQWMIITSSLFIMLSFSRFILKYSKNVWLSVFLFFCLFFNSSMTAIRQYIAISILFLAFESILKRNKIKFFIYIILAFLFHYASLIFLIAYPLYNCKVSRKRITQFFMLLPLLGFSALYLVRPLFEILQSYGLYAYYSADNKYIEEGIKIATFINIFLYLYMMILPLKTWKIMEGNLLINDSPIDRILFYFVMMCIFLFVVSIPFNLIDRFVHYFSVYLCVFLPNAMYELSKRKNTNAWCLSLISILSVRYLAIDTFRPEWFHVYPYSFY